MFKAIPNSTSPLSPWESPHFNRSRFRILSPTVLPRKMPPSVLLGKAEASTPAPPSGRDGCSTRRPALMAGRVGPAPEGPEGLRWGSSSCRSSRDSLRSPAFRVSCMARSAFLMAARLLPLAPPSIASELKVIGSVEQSQAIGTVSHNTTSALTGSSTCGKCCSAHHVGCALVLMEVFRE